MDLRDKWLGIRQLKSEYQPNPYNRKRKNGTHIPLEKRAEEAAKYLQKEQWGKETSNNIPSNTGTQQTRGTQNTTDNYNIGEISMEELREVIKKFKKRKAPGPDEIPMEILKELDTENLEEVRQLLNEWWEKEEIPKETLQARVVMIYKKGGTGKYENYRPISLLNSIYKIYAAITQRRLAEILDEHLQKTQYGFRKNKSTADAIHLIRRAAEHGHQTNNKLHMVLLNWEKAFDKVDREEMMKSLEKMRVNKKLVGVIRSIYKKTEFMVEIEGNRSEWKEQETGIRQGCPLSPYLFIIVMTTMFEELKTQIQGELIKHRIPGIDFDEVMYADDTICISADTKTMNKFIKQIEETGNKYGLKLNKGKCV